ncbi:hypothetical protein HED50_21640 [Ochrobactrum oryzae]|nr:hypothetical protein [Brucella oryzae]
MKARDTALQLQQSVALAIHQQHFVCLNRGSSCFQAFERARHLCVNTLMPGQEDISDHFGGRLPTKDRFAIGIGGKV